MDSKKLSSSALEPDFIVEGEKVVYMSDIEQKRRVVFGLLLLYERLGSQLRGGRS